MKSFSGRLLCISTLSLVALFHARAAKQGISREQAEALVSGLKFQQGEIALHNGLATLHVPDGFRSTRCRNGHNCCRETRIFQGTVGSDPRGKEVYHHWRGRDRGISSEAL
jgi:hypothetical protein